MLDVLVRPPAAAAARCWRLAAAMLPAAIGGFAAMSVTGLLAVPAAAGQPGPTRRRHTSVAVTLAVMLLLSLPWLVPALSRWPGSGGRVRIPLRPGSPDAV